MLGVRCLHQIMVARPRVAPGPLSPRQSSADPYHPVSRRDGKLLDAIRRREDGMAAAFYKRVKPMVDQTVRRLLGRLDGDVEDVVQVALEQLIESLPRYRRECPFNVWVSAVAANVVHKHI